MIMNEKKKKFISLTYIHLHIYKEYKLWQIQQTKF